MKNNNINYFRIVKILFLSSLVGTLYNFSSGNGLPLIRKSEKLIAVSDSALFSQSPQDSEQLALISTEQAYELFKSGKALFIDARDQWDFAEGHIPGAINIPEFSFEPNDSTANSLDKTAQYVVYCHGLDCDVATRLAKELEKLGFKNLLIYADGWDVWAQNGYAAETEKAE